MNLKSIVDKLQSEKAYFKTQVEKLKIEKNDLAVSNKSLAIKVDSLQEELQKKNSVSLVIL